MPEGLPLLAAWQWLALGLPLLALGIWRRWIVCRSLGAGAAMTALAVWSLSPTGAAYRFVLFAVLSGIAFLAARRAAAWEAGGPDPEDRRVLGLMGRNGRVSRAIAGGRGRVTVAGREWVATGPDLPEGAAIKVAGHAGEVLKVIPRGDDGA